MRPEFLDFIRGAELVIHNAAFDVGFLNAELARLGPAFGRIEDHAAGVLDTVQIAKQQFPGQRVSLDALCKKLGVDNGHRTVHGALLDAELLAEVCPTKRTRTRPGWRPSRRSPVATSSGKPGADARDHRGGPTGSQIRRSRTAVTLSLPPPSSAAATRWSTHS